MDPSLDSLRIAANNCSSYTTLLEAVKTLSPEEAKQLPASDPACQYKSVWGDLSVHTDGQLVLFQSDRIVVPQQEHQRLLQLLHKGHYRITTTWTLDRQLYYWPGILNDISNMVSTCDMCVAHLPQQRPLPLQQTESSLPLQSTSADLFSLSG